MRLKSKCFTALLLAVTFDVLLSAAFGANALSASMTLEARASIDNVTEVVDIDSDAWGPLLNPLSIEVDATAVSDTSSASVNARGAGSANWLSANQGSVGFNDIGWTFNNALGTATINTGIDWQYTFTAGADGTFTMHGEVQGQGDVFGLWGWYAYVDGGPEGSQTGGFQDAFDPNATWDFSANLTAGQTYTASLRNNANIYGTQPLSTEGSMNSQFDWRITAVPEPHIGALLCSGGIMAGVMPRRRRGG